MNPVVNDRQASADAIRKLSVLIPLYNERWTLETIIRRVLAVPLDLELELIVVDDGSSDGSWEELQRIAGEDSRIRTFRHQRNRGKGAAIRTAIDHMSGDVAVVQDADLEYDPHDYLRLLTPIRDGRADAVFGSRFAGETHRVLYFWHSLGNQLLTLLSNMVNDVNLTDMETCYKMVRTDVLRQIRLQSNTFTLEPEITCRLAQWGARIYEVPIGYSGRTYLEGKKIKAIDGAKVFWELFRCRCLDPQFSHHRDFYLLKSTARARKYNRWLLDQCRPYLGSRVLELDAGIGSLSALLLNCPQAGAGEPRPAVRLPAAQPVRPTRQSARHPIRPGQARRLDALERRTDRYRSLLQRSGAAGSGRASAAFTARRLAARRPLHRHRSGRQVAIHRHGPGARASAPLRHGGTAGEDGAGRLRNRLLAQRRPAGVALLVVLWQDPPPPADRPAANAAGGSAAAAHPPAGLLPARSGRDDRYGRTKKSAQ